MHPRRLQLATDLALTWLLLALTSRALLHHALHDPLVWLGAWQDVLLTLPLVLLGLLPAVGLPLSLLLLGILALLARAYAAILLAMHAGLDRQSLETAWQSGELQAVLQNANLRDWLAVLVWPLLLLVLRALPWGRLRVRPLLVIFALVGLLTASLVAPRQSRLWPQDAAHNPLLHLLLSTPRMETEGFDLPPQPQTPELARDLSPTALSETPTPGGQGAQKNLPQKADHPWNVVWFIMESTGTRYFEGETFPQKPPMPFLQKLASEGWYLARHQSPSNSSATSIFAQLSGLYPSPQLQMFSVQPDNWIPALPSYLPNTYQKFLYTPGRLTYFFPRAFLQHSGLTDMTGFDETTVTKNPGGEFFSKDEIEVMSTFLQRIHTAPEPFLGIYYSYAPHWPYTDYGAKWRRYGGGRLIDHYHDNLWLLDKQIERVVEQLRADGRLERTILIFVGDHGEAFGQHERNWAHARGSYRENFETPAILWQPKLFPPRRIDTPTQHVDLLPTLLDALRIPYDAAQFQGESLFQDHPRRKLQFFWSNEGMATVQRDDGIKLSWSPQEKRCRVHNLQTDSQEKHPQSCQHYAELLQVLQNWRDTQREMLKARSEQIRRQHQP